MTMQIVDRCVQLAEIATLNMVVYLPAPEEAVTDADQKLYRQVVASRILDILQPTMDSLLAGGNRLIIECHVTLEASDGFRYETGCKPEYLSS